MPTLSLIIPTLRIGTKLEDCLKSLEGEYDELILIDDKIDNLAEKINKGLSQAKGDNIVVSNDDIVLEKGHLIDLCVAGQILSPKLISGVNKAFHAHMWGMTRFAYEAAVGTMPGYTDYEKPGYFEGYYKFYYDDSDYWMKLKGAGYEPVINENVVIRHDHPGHTLKSFGDNSSAEKSNRELFVERWGIDALRIVE